MSNVGDYIAAELEECATLAKAGTIHAGHDGWSFVGPEHVLRCVCGEVLVDPTPPPPLTPAELAEHEKLWAKVRRDHRPRW